jgi:hypothetical protein
MFYSTRVCFFSPLFFFFFNLSIAQSVEKNGPAVWL